MKQPKKIFTRMLINNWGGISHKMLEFHEYVNLFSGKSGSGKSTVMDAIQVVLYGSVSANFLNKAADDSKNKRSVLSYLRGAQKDGTANRGDVDFCSQIVLEIEDTATHIVTCVGAAFEVAKGDTDLKKYTYFSHSGRIPKDEYLENNVPYSIAQIRKLTEERSRSADNRGRGEVNKVYPSKEAYLYTLYGEIFGQVEQGRMITMEKSAIALKMTSGTGQFEDPRKQQLRYIKQIEQLRAEVQGSFLEGYYDEIIRRLELGEIVKSPDMEDVDFFRCLNAVVNLKKSLWMRVFSAAVLNDSKRFKKDYEKKVVKVLVRSPLYEEGMTDDEILSVHGILSYAQVMEWKGPLLYKLKGGQEYIEDKAREKEYEIDTSQNQYGTVINSQTLERAFPVSIKGVQRIVTIENKANYEEMKYREDTLYLFCHGFYSPKERIFLKRLMEVAEGEIQYFHWGDMDMGGIRIFRFNKKNIFPKLKPYKMDREAFQEALERGAGIPLEEKKKEKLEKLNAGELEELKKCILEKGVEIEQEILLAENAIAEN